MLLNLHDRARKLKNVYSVLYNAVFGTTSFQAMKKRYCPRVDKFSHVAQILLRPLRDRVCRNAGFKDHHATVVYEQVVISSTKQPVVNIYTQCLTKITLQSCSFLS